MKHLEAGFGRGVMGRRNGFIALEAGLAGGAEAIIIPEMPYSIAEIGVSLQTAADKGKRSSIIRRVHASELTWSPNRSRTTAASPQSSGLGTPAGSGAASR